MPICREADGLALSRCGHVLHLALITGKTIIEEVLGQQMDMLALCTIAIKSCPPKSCSRGV